MMCIALSSSFYQSVERPASAVMLLLAMLAMTIVLLPSLRKKREEAFQED